jgi:predicted negative regulator of RcsB-dependent stress response
MVEDYLSEREQAEALRNWWKENWRWLIGGVALGFALLGGWKYFESYRTQRAEAAAKSYAELETAVAANDATKIEQRLSELAKEYGSSPYVQQGRLLLARNRVEAGKLDEAIALLQAVVDTAKDEELGKVARVRIARVLLQQGKHDEALKLLDADKAGKFAPSVHEVRGDVLFAKGDAAGARTEYAAALAADRDVPLDRPALELKLAEAGGTPEPANTQAAAGEQAR